MAMPQEVRELPSDNLGQLCLLAMPMEQAYANDPG